MANYVGDYNPGSTVLIYFNTFDSNDPAASVTMTNFINTDVHIHKGSDETQRNNAAGVTVNVDVDGIAGCHLISIDTSDDTVAGFYVAGSDYGVRIEGVTVDAGTLNPWVGHFSLDNRNVAGVLCKTTIATLASQTSFTLTTASADDDAYNNCLIVVTDKASAIQKCIGRISDYTGGTKTVTLAADPAIFTMAAGDNVSILATSALANLSSVIGEAVTTSGTAGLLDVNVIQWASSAAPTIATVADINAEVDTALSDIGLDHLVSAAVVGADVIDNSIVAKLVSKSATADWDDYVNTTDSLQGIQDNIGVAGVSLTAVALADTTSDAVVAHAVWGADATTYQTQGTFGQAIGDPVSDATTIYQAVATDAAGDNVSIDVIAVKADTAAILTDTAEIGAAGVGLTAVALADTTSDVVVAHAVWGADATTYQTQGTFGQAIGDPAADATTIYQAVATDAAGDNVAIDIIAAKADTAAILTDTGTTLDAKLDKLVSSGIIANGTLGATGNDTTHLHLVGLDYANDGLNGYGIVVYDNSATKYYATTISDWVLASALATVPTLGFTPEASTDLYWVLPPQSANLQFIHDVPVVGDGAAPKFGI